MNVHSIVNKRALKHLLNISDSYTANAAADKLFVGVLNGSALYLAATDMRAAVKVSLLPGPQNVCDIYCVDAEPLDELLSAVKCEELQIRCICEGERAVAFEFDDLRVEAKRCNIALKNIFAFAMNYDSVKCFDDADFMQKVLKEECIMLSRAGVFAFNAVRENGEMTIVDDTCAQIAKAPRFGFDVNIDVGVLRRALGDVVHPVYAIDVEGEARPIRLYGMCERHPVEIAVMPIFFV